MKPTDRFQLTDTDRSSALWQRLRTHYEKRLHILRQKNDGPLGAEETLLLRGRITEVKTLLSLHDAISVTSPKE